MAVGAHDDADGPAHELFGRVEFAPVGMAESVEFGGDKGDQRRDRGEALTRESTVFGVAVGIVDDSRLVRAVSSEWTAGRLLLLLTVLTMTPRVVIASAAKQSRPARLNKGLLPWHPLAALARLNCTKSCSRSFLGIFFRHVLRYPADGEAVAAIVRSGRESKCPPSTTSQKNAN